MANEITPTALERIAALRRDAAMIPVTEEQTLRRANATKVLRQLARGVSPPALEGWHPSPGTPWEGLDSVDTPEVRARWFRNLYGDD